MVHARGNPGKGGWGAILMFGDIKKEISGFARETTNNQMELTGPIEALSLLKKPCKVKLYSDSAYLVNAFNEGWIYNWQRNGWKTSGKQDVKNRDLWERIYAFTKIHDIEWIKVKGHSTNEFNNRCDEMAVNAIKQIKE